MLMEVAGKDILSGHVSLSASISQSQEVLRQKTFGNHGNIPFWLVKSKQRTAITATNRKNTFVFQKYLLIKFFQKKSHPRHPDINTQSKLSFQLNYFSFAGLERTIEKKGTSKCSNITPLLNQGTVQMATVTPQGQFFVATATAQA